MLLQRAQGPQGEDIRFLFVADDDLPPGATLVGDDQHLVFSYREALDLALRAAEHLRARGVTRGDRVLLMLPTGPTFMAAYYGCQLLGAAPVPVVPPVSLNRMEDHLKRIARIAKICTAKAVVVGSQMMPVFKVVCSRDKEAKRSLGNAIRGSDLLAEETPLAEPVTGEALDPAMLQFTSGSTGDPKGVVLPHRSILSNMQAIGQAAQFGPTDVALAWLPLFHDMGLIGHFLAAVSWGIPLVLLPPEVFIRRPKEWLKAMSRYRGTCSAAPNFAYSLCAKKCKDADLAGVDLGCWRVAFCGAEPINPDTVTTFVDRFKSFGFRATSFFPVYGMAEFSLAATFPDPKAEPRFDTVHRLQFESKGIAEPYAGSEADGALSVTWVGVGQALPGHEVRVVDAQGTLLPERREGEVEVTGPSLMAGYYKNPLATAETLRGKWLRTGDRGYLADGELFVTGRSKEVIIKGGKNLYPQDVEAAAAQVKGVRVGCCAAFGVRNQKRGTEDLILVCETREEDPDARGRMQTAIRNAVLEAVGATPDTIVLVGPGTVPKTSSGKIQRGLMRERFVANDLKPGRASTMTLVRLKIAMTLEAVRKRTFGSLRRKRP
ncbi:MAG: fatty acyl-AMP ligase [Planctomycetes bacterium]|nr:fatty acyl-AMP ligase [Planctomycetota bacterium]